MYTNEATRWHQEGEWWGTSRLGAWCLTAPYAMWMDAWFGDDC